MNTFLTYAWTEIKLFLREPMAAFFSLVFPLMMLFIFGSIYGNEPNPFFGGYGSVDVSVPSYAAMIIATNGLLTLAIAIATQRELGVLRRLRATPVRPQSILAAQVAVIFLMTAAGMIALIIAGKVAYGLRFGGNLVNVIAGFTLSSLSFFALGFILASLAPTARTAQVVALVLFYPMIFLSGATIPTEVLPATIKNYAQILPLTHVVNLLRGFWTGHTWGEHIKEVLILSGMLVVSVAISIRTFRWE